MASMVNMKAPPLLVADIFSLYNNDRDIKALTRRTLQWYLKQQLNVRIVASLSSRLSCPITRLVILMLTLWMLTIMSY